MSNDLDNLDEPTPSTAPPPIAGPAALQSNPTRLPHAVENMGTGFNPPIHDAPLPPAPPTLPRLPRTVALMSNIDHRQQHMRTVVGERADAEAAITGALSAQNRIATAFEAFEQARQTYDPRITAADHLNRVERSYQTLLKQAAMEHDAARARIRDRRGSLESEISTAIGLSPSTDAAEIRQALRGMTSEERGKALTAALERKDGAVLHAALTGRELTTGVSDAQQRSFRRRAEQLYAPQLAGVRAGLDEADALIQSAFDDLESLASRVKGSPKVVSEFERQAQAADAAWLALNRHLSA